MFARRRLVQPDVIPSVEGARADGTTARAPAAELSESARLWPHHGPMGPRPTHSHVRRCHRAPTLEGPRSTKLTSTCGKPAGCSKESDAFRPKPRTRPDPSLNPRAGRSPDNKVIFSCRYNVRRSPASRATRRHEHPRSPCAACRVQRLVGRQCSALQLSHESSLRAAARAS